MYDYTIHRGLEWINLKGSKTKDERYDEFINLKIYQEYVDLICSEMFILPGQPSYENNRSMVDHNIKDDLNDRSTFKDHRQLSLFNDK